MVKDEYFSFTEMIEKGKISRTTLYRLIKDGKIKSQIKEIAPIKVYSLKDVINNKPRKK